MNLPLHSKPPLGAERHFVQFNHPTSTQPPGPIIPEIQADSTSTRIFHISFYLKITVKLRLYDHALTLINQNLTKCIDDKLQSKSSKMYTLEISIKILQNVQIINFNQNLLKRID